ncbi:biotin/lipoyl-containing protein [Anaerovorax odorimutans]|uniref:biotin/lipoyl-containing protein n=1 Tax=Anaerovorax odorimutans TaxID=109327 RepID=UPI000421F684|nr:biotin/lipoyl-containing protein [Anaerovorax odorimutans]
MKKYNIVVNGTAYAVEVEELGTGSAATQTPAAAPAQTPAAAPAKAAAPAPAPAPAKKAPAAAPSAGAQTVDCPMPGTVLDIKVNVGDTVTEGQVLLILEAMKMENEIAAPAAGTVDTIQVTKGAAVNAGDVLISLK